MTGWLIEALLATMVLMLVILAVRGQVARIFGPRVAYALWLLPAVRMVLPPLPQGWFTLSAPEITAPTATAIPLIWIAAAWLAGATAFFLWHAMSYGKFARSVSKEAVPLFEEDAVHIAQSKEVASPLAFGVVRKAIMLPTDFRERYTEREQAFAIEHELTHHRRWDMAANMVALIVLALHWFNPIAHVAFRAFRADQEAACDALVLKDADDRDRADYGNALVKSALSAAPLMACRISAAQGIKQRLGYIVSARETAPWHETGLTMAGVAIIAGLGLTASATTPPVNGRSDQPVFALIEKPKPAALMISKASQPAQIAALDAGPVRQDDAILVRARATDKSTTERVNEVLAANQGSPAHAALPATLEAPPVVTQEPVLNKVPTNGLIVEARNDAKQPAPIEAAELGCKANQALLSSQQVFVSEAGSLDLSLRLCLPADATPAVQRAAIVQGLQMTKVKLSRDDSVPGTARRGLLNAIDEQIRQIRENEV